MLIDYEDADWTAAPVREFATLLDDIAPVKVAWILGEARIRDELAWHRARRVEIPAAGR